MFTLKQKLASLLDEKGLMPDEIEQVLEKYLNKAPNMRERLGDNEADYSLPTISTMWMLLSSCALEWIEENCPQHWAKPFFMQ